jgi:predicted ribosome quality control (RQC) complex YloA/Tae2 family protein
MNFDSVMMAAVAHELQDALLEGRVERITQPSPLEVVMHVYNQGRKYAVLFSADPANARVHLTEIQRPKPPTPPSFCMLLRKYLEGGWIEGIEHPFGYGERAIRFVVLSGDKSRVYLYAETMGKHSNLILTTSDNKILGAIKIITTQISRFREIKPGIKYFPPPKMRSVKRDAYAGDAGNDLPAVTFASADEAQEWLMAHFSGVSPLMAAEGVARSHGASLTSESVWYGLNDLLNLVRLADYAPVQHKASSDAPKAAYPVPLASVAAERQQRWTSFNAALDDAFGNLELTDTIDRERAALLSALRKAHKTCEHEIIDTEEGLANADRAEEYKQDGDLLLTRLRDVVAGASEVILEDYFATDGPATREIQLDPKLSAKDNAERYYRKYQKARDAYERLTERHADLAEALLSIEIAIDRVSAARDLAALNSIAETFGDEVNRRLKKTNSQAAAKPGETKEDDIFAGHRIRRYRSIDGWEIFVGENATSNDYLTTKIAAPNDIWLHARAIASAHAVIRSQNRPASVSAAALRLAAEQVAKRSDAKHARLVPVDYTLKKHVRKPRKAAPGAVTYSNEKTLDVTAGE